MAIVAFITDTNGFNNLGFNSIVGINKIIPAFAYARKKLYFKLFGFLYHGTKLVEKTQKKFTKVRILDLVPVRNARKRYPPFS